MRIRTLLLSTIILLTSGTAFGQGLVRFSNITELGVSFQVGSTEQEITYVDIAGNEQTATTDIDGYSIPAPRLMTSFGVMVWELLFIGAGAGYQYQPKDDALPYQHHVTGFGQARIHFAKGRFRPFTDLRVGYNYMVNEIPESNLLSDDNFKWDGLMVEPSIGFAIKLGGKALLNVGLAYQFLRVDQRESIADLWTDVTTNNKRHSLALNVGFTFK